MSCQSIKCTNTLKNLLETFNSAVLKKTIDFSNKESTHSFSCWYEAISSSPNISQRFNDSMGVVKIFCRQKTSRINSTHYRLWQNTRNPFKVSKTVLDSKKSKKCLTRKNLIT